MSWIKLDRCILEWQWFTDAETLQLLLYLIMIANIEPKKWQGMTVERGQVITSPEKLAIATGQSVQKIRTRLERLRDGNTIATKATNKYTIITVCNYDKYQYGVDDEQQTNNKQITNKQQTNNKQITNKQQTNNKQITTTKEYKELKNIDNNSVVQNSIFDSLNIESENDPEILSKSEAVDIIPAKQNTPKKTSTKGGEFGIEIELPFRSEKFKDVWQKLRCSKKWKNKAKSALEMSLKKLSKYDEVFAIELIEKAIAGEYQGVVFANTDKDYERWQQGRGNIANNTSYNYSGKQNF